MATLKDHNPDLKHSIKRRVLPSCYPGCKAEHELHMKQAKITCLVIRPLISPPDLWIVVNAAIVGPCWTLGWSIVHHRMSRGKFGHENLVLSSN